MTVIDFNKASAEKRANRADGRTIQGKGKQCPPSAPVEAPFQHDEYTAARLATRHLAQKYV